MKICAVFAMLCRVYLMTLTLLNPGSAVHETSKLRHNLLCLWALRASKLILQTCNLLVVQLCGTQMWQYRSMK